jgi:hypothetical protein
MSQRPSAGNGSLEPPAAGAAPAPASSGLGAHVANGHAHSFRRAADQDAIQQCHERAANARFVEDPGIGGAGGGVGRAVIDWEDPKIKEEVLRMIAAYLQGEGYVASSMMLMDEANLRRSGMHVN